MVSLPVRLRNVLPPAVRLLVTVAAKVNVPLPSVGVVADAGWASSAVATTIARSATAQVRARSPKREVLLIIDVSSPHVLFWRTTGHYASTLSCQSAATTGALGKATALDSAGTNRGKPRFRSKAALRCPKARARVNQK